MRDNVNIIDAQLESAKKLADRVEDMANKGFAPPVVSVSSGVQKYTIFQSIGAVREPQKYYSILTQTTKFVIFRWCTYDADEGSPLCAF
jgi:hypothetical protein